MYLYRQTSGFIKNVDEHQEEARMKIIGLLAKIVVGGVAGLFLGGILGQLLGAFEGVVLDLWGGASVIEPIGEQAFLALMGITTGAVIGGIGVFFNRAVFSINSRPITGVVVGTIVGLVVATNAGFREGTVLQTSGKLMLIVGSIGLSVGLIVGLIIGIMTVIGMEKENSVLTDEEKKRDDEFAAFFAKRLKR